MKTQLLIAASLLVAASGLLGCTGDDTNSTTPGNDSGPGTDSATPGDSGPNPGTDAGDSGSGNPAPPTLGLQIDRMGRPAINTALNHGFDGNAATSGPAKDTYNSDTNVATWGASYAPQFAANLAILDSLDKGALANDGGGCGNQPYADNDAGADRYKTLSTVLAGDMLWLNTAGTTSTQYLAVELNATGVSPNTDSGGRMISFDVIQTTYSIVSGVGLTGFGSGVSAVAAKTNGTTFPYLATPL